MCDGYLISHKLHGSAQFPYREDNSKCVCVWLPTPTKRGGKRDPMSVLEPRKGTVGIDRDRAPVSPQQTPDLRCDPRLRRVKGRQVDGRNISGRRIADDDRTALERQSSRARMG